MFKTQYRWEKSFAWEKSSRKNRNLPKKFKICFQILGQFHGTLLVEFTFRKFYWGDDGMMALEVMKLDDSSAPCRNGITCSSLERDSVVYRGTHMQYARENPCFPLLAKICETLKSLTETDRCTKKSELSICLASYYHFCLQGVINEFHEASRGFYRSRAECKLSLNRTFFLFLFF